MLLMAAYLFANRPYKELVAVAQGAASTVCRLHQAAQPVQCAAQRCHALLLMAAHLFANQPCKELEAVTQAIVNTVCRAAPSSTARTMCCTEVQRLVVDGCTLLPEHKLPSFVLGLEHLFKLLDPTHTRLLCWDQLARSVVRIRKCTRLSWPQLRSIRPGLVHAGCQHRFLAHRAAVENAGVW